MIVGLIDTATPNKVLQRTVHTERGGAGKSDSVVTAVRYSRQPDHAVKNALAGSGRCGVRGSGYWGTPPIDIKALLAKIGELTLENDF